MYSFACEVKQIPSSAVKNSTGVVSVAFCSTPWWAHVS
jgi:hypothetical protein